MCGVCGDIFLTNSHVRCMHPRESSLYRAHRADKAFAPGSGGGEADVWAPSRGGLGELAPADCS